METARSPSSDGMREVVFDVISLLRRVLRSALMQKTEIVINHLPVHWRCAGKGAFGIEQHHRERLMHAKSALRQGVLARLHRRRCRDLRYPTCIEGGFHCQA